MTFLAVCYLSEMLDKALKLQKVNINVLTVNPVSGYYTPSFAKKVT